MELAIVTNWLLMWINAILEIKKARHGLWKEFKSILMLSSQSLTLMFDIRQQQHGIGLTYCLKYAAFHVMFSRYDESFICFLMYLHPSLYSLLSSSYL